MCIPNARHASRRWNLERGFAAARRAAPANRETLPDRLTRRGSQSCTAVFPDPDSRIPISRSRNRGAFSNSGFSRAFGPHASHASRADAQTGCHSAMTAGALLRAAARSFASNRSSGLAVAAQQVRPRANDPRIREAPLRRDIFPDRPFGVAVRATRRARNAPSSRFSTSAFALVPALVFAARLTDARAPLEPRTPRSTTDAIVRQEDGGFRR